MLSTLRKIISKKSTLNAEFFLMVDHMNKSKLRLTLIFKNLKKITMLPTQLKQQLSGSRKQSRSSSMMPPIQALQLQKSFWLILLKLLTFLLALARLALLEPAVKTTDSRTAEDEPDISMTSSSSISMETVMKMKRRLLNSKSTLDSGAIKITLCMTACWQRLQSALTQVNKDASH